LPLVQRDRVKLQQALLNLIINAIEAMCGVSQEERELLISTGNETNGVLVEVRDAGPGLAPTTVSRIFEAFYTTKPGGLGSARLEPSSVSRADFVIMSFGQNSLEWRQVCVVSGHSGVLDRTGGFDPEQCSHRRCSGREV